MRDERGSNAVEFALVLPLLIVIVFGILWGGIAYNRQLAMTQSAREGARFGATLPFDDDAPDSGWYSSIRGRIADVSAGELRSDGSLGFICIRYIGPSGTAEDPSTVGSGSCSDDDFPDNAEGERVQVLVQREATIELVFFRLNPLLSGRGVARFEASS